MRRMFPALFLAALLATAAHAQAVGDTIEIKGWRVHLAANEDGSYTCAAMWPFGDGSAVGFGADSAQRTYLIIAQPQAGLTKNQPYPAKFHVDRAMPKTVAATATSPVMLVMPIADPDTDFAALGAGKSVTIEFAGNTYEKPLQGSHEAIRALARCIAGAPTP